MMLPCVTLRSWSKSFTCEDELILCCQSEIAEVSRVEQRPQQRINRYYQRLEQRFQRWCAGVPYERTAELWRMCRSRSRPFEVVELYLTCQAQEQETENELPILLTYARKSGGERLYFAQQIAYWSLKTGLAEVKEG